MVISVNLYLTRGHYISVDFIDAIPVDKAGVWIIHGWDKAIPKDCDERKGVNQYFDKLKSSGTAIVKAALKKM